MKKVIGAACLASMLSMGIATAADAQNPTTTTIDRTVDEDDGEGDDSGKYGLVGLLGLLGLAGLMKRDRDDHDDHDDRYRGSRTGTATRTDNVTGPY